MEAHSMVLECVCWGAGRVGGGVACASVCGWA
jgi:hypothetical protein